MLPTGRNFYSVDVRNLPTTTAWRLGFASATQIHERHVQDHRDHLRHHRRAHQQRIKLPHFVMQQANRISVRIIGPKAV